MAEDTHPVISPAPVDLGVDIGGIRMKNPVMVASGTFGYGPEYADVVDLNQLGAFVVKGVRVDPWPGNPTPRLVEVRGGLVNAIGLQSPGFDVFVAHYLPFFARFDVPVIVNIWGQTEAEYFAIAERFDDVPGVAGLELNVSCPNVKAGGIAFGTDAAVMGALVEGVRARTRLPLLVKLAPNVPNIRGFAETAERAGANAISLINTIPAMVIDVETRKPVLANRVGGLSGPAIHPVAVKLVWEAAQAVKIPVVGMGGIETANDALELMIAGASAVAVGTANFADPNTFVKVLAGIRDYMLRHGFGRVASLVGSVVA